MQDNAFRYPHISRTIPPEGGHIGYKDWKYIWYVQGFRDENPVQNFSVGGGNVQYGTDRQMFSGIPPRRIDERNLRIPKWNAGYRPRSAWTSVLT